MSKKLLTTCAFFVLISQNAIAKKGYADASPLETTEFAVCTAAAMRSGKGIGFYQKWSKPLTKRYELIFPQKTSREIDAYTAERVIDKRRALERKGISTAPAFFKFYEENCKDYEP